MSNKPASRPWTLQAFVDSLVVELDKTRDTLAIKGLNQPMSYAVKDISLDLHLFPEFDGSIVRFVSAKPGETSASKLSIDLGSITDRQIRQTTKEPPTAEDVSIDEIDEIDEDTKQDLRKIGVSTVKDIEDLEKQAVNVDRLPQLKKHQMKRVNPDQPSRATLTEELKQKKTDTVNRSRMETRQKMKPAIKGVSLNRYKDDIIATVKGENLAVYDAFRPKAILNDTRIEVLPSNPTEVRLKFNKELIQKGPNEVKLMLDPYAIVKFNLK